MSEIKEDSSVKDICAIGNIISNSEEVSAETPLTFNLGKSEDEIDVPEIDNEEYVEDLPFDVEENRKKFLASLTPEKKAEIVLAIMENQEGGRRYYGHERRLVRRKLERNARKGLLDKYFK